MRRIFFVGPFPPPISGQAVMTAFIAEQLSASGADVVPINVIRGGTQSKLRNMMVRVLRVINAGSQLTLQLKRGEAAYLSLDANAGMIVTVLLALVARARRAEVFIHHHSYSHISSTRALMRLLAWVAGPKAAHICICSQMLEELRGKYEGVRRGFHLSNAVNVPLTDTSPSYPQPKQTFVLGHMAKLGPEKGLQECVQTLTNLLERGVEAELWLAGRYADQAARAYVKHAETQHPGRIKYLGEIGGPEKAAFFSRIDVFLFPTRYSNETQGIVNLEALSYGKPVFAYGRCCIPGDLEGSGGLVVSPDQAFVTTAVPHLEALAMDAAARDRASRCARARFNELRIQSKKQLDGLINALSCQSVGAVPHPDTLVY